VPASPSLASPASHSTTVAVDLLLSRRSVCPYSDGVLYDLRDLLADHNPWRLLYAWDINDTGQIVCHGLYRDGTVALPRAVLLTPNDLDAPSSLGARGLSPTRIDLEWTDNSEEEIGFEIERKGPTGNWASVATVPAGTTQFSDTGMAPHRSYRYRVRAVGADGISDWSNEASADAGSGAVLELGASTLDFGSVLVGGTARQSITITNRGTAPLYLLRPYICGTRALDFGLRRDTDAGPIPRNGSRTIAIEFRPRGIGQRRAVLMLPNNGVGGTQRVTLVGQGIAPGFAP
jgi:hypothetical protein